MSRQTMKKTMTRATSKATAPRAAALARCAFACALALSLALPAEGLAYAFADAGGSDAASAATAAGEASVAVAAKDAAPAAESGGSGDAVAPGEGDAAAADDSDAVGEPEDSGEVPAQGGEGEEQDAPELGPDATDDDGPASEAPEGDAEEAEAASPDAASESRASPIYFRVTNDATGAAIGGNYTNLQDAIDACPVRKACTVKLVGGNYIIGPTTEAARTKMYQEITLTSDTGSRIIFRQQSNFYGKAANRHIYVELYSKFVLKGIALEGPRKNAAGELDTSFLNEAGGVSSEGYLELGPGSVISFCSGSGVYENGNEHGSLTINGGIVKKCYSVSGGGGVCCILASFEMNSGNIEDNRVVNFNNFASNQGGGLALYSTDNMGAPFVINGGTIRNNTIEHPSTWKEGGPESQGGGVYVGSGHLIMTGGAITGNSAFDGGGVALCSAGHTSSSSGDDARFTMTGGTITGNTALCDGGGIVCFPFNPVNLNLGGSMKGYYAEPMLDDLSDGDNPYRNLRISGSATVSGNHATLSGAVVPPSNAASYNALFPGSLLNNNEVNYRRLGDEMSVVPNNGTSEPNVVFRCDDPWTNWRDRFNLTASMFSGLTPPTINTHIESLNTAADGSGTSYQVPSTDNKVPLMREPTTTLYAQWSINQATIEFDSQGGVPASQTITVDVDDPINWFPPVEKHGQVLLGWFTQPSGGTEVHTTDTPLTLDPSVQHGDTITVYAHWVDAVCQRITPNPYGGEYLNGTYATFEEGFGAMRGGDRLELIRNAELSSRAQSYLMGGNGTRTVTTAPTVNPVSGACEWLGPAPAAGEAPRAEIRRSSASGSIVVAGSGSSTITADFENVIIDGGSKASVPIAGTVESLLVTTGIASLRLGDGAVVRNVMATCATASGTAVGQPIFIDSTPDPSTGKSFIIDDGALIEDLHITTTSGGLGSGTMSPISVCTSGVKVLMKGGTVRNCSSNMNGGAFGIWNTTNSLEIGGNAVVENNHADFRGGAVYGYVELKDNAVVRNNTAGEAGGGVFGTGSIAGDALIQGNRAPAGGGIYAALVSINSGFKFQGGRITGNTATGIGGVYPSVTPSAASGGGGVYTDFYLPSSEFSGNPVIWGNTGALGDDNMLVGIDASVLPADVVASKLKVVSPGMDPNAKVGVNVALANMLPYQVPSDYLGLGARFGVYSPLALNQFLDAFIDDIDHSLLGADGGAVGTSVANTGHAVWGTAVCQIIRPNATTGVEEFWRGYTSVQNAVAAAQDGDRIELLKDVDLNGPAVGDWASGTVELTTAPVIQPVAGASAWQGLAGAGVTPRATVSCTAASSGMSVQGGGELSTKNIVFKQPTGAPSMLGSLFLLQNASSLTLDDGTEVKDFKLAVGALIASDGSACEVLFEPGSSVHDSREVVHLAGQGDVSVRGGEFYAISGGTCVFNMDAGTKLAISGGSFHDNASRWEGGVVRSAGDVELTGGEFFDNKAADGYRGGAVFVYDSSGGTDVNSFSIGGNVHVHDNSVKGNVSTGAVHAAGIPAIIEGSPVIEDNVKYKADGSLEEGHYDYFLDTASTLAVSGALGTSASIGIRTVVANNPGDQFATYDAGANVNLDKFFDNANPLLVGSDGGSGRAIWKLALVDTSFTKVGASQEPGGAHGLYSGLPGAKFNVYEYVGAAPLTQAALDSGAVGPAGTASADWAPLLDAAGTVGAAGNTSNVPHEFVSDGNGKVDLTKVKPNAWYMLVETEAPAGYQLPQGQWAFQVSDPDGDGTYAIDTSSVLACKGPAGGSLPPAMATSVETSSGTETGVFVVNTPEFGLPHAGVLPQLPLALLAGAALMAAAWALRRKRARIGRHAG